MKKFLLALLLTLWQLSAHAADLLEVYEQALMSDPIYQQAISQRCVTREGVPISIAQLLPNISLTMVPSVTRVGFTGSNLKPIDSLGTLSARNLTERTFNTTLTVTQTVFNFAQFANVSSQLALARGADATLNAALQNLMIRVANAYFTILKDEDNLRYSKATKLAYQQQLNQVRQEYQVGVKTITDLYTAEASYDSALANYIAAKTTLANDRENLRVITGKYYPYLQPLSEKFPLIRPQPANMEIWVATALRQNWSIKSAQYSVESAKEVIKQQIAGHFPTMSLQGTYNRLYQENINRYNSVTDPVGPGTEIQKTIALNVNVPIFSGGGVAAQTNQATYNYHVIQQQLEQTIRNTLNTTRQSYLGVLLGISQVNADRQAIKSSISSLNGMQASYEVGTETLVNVLNQREKVFQAQTQYATDRYNFVNNVLTLKQSAGTLSFDDLRAINAWLIHGKSRAKQVMLNGSG